jgi:hypothetical protein
MKRWLGGAAQAARCPPERRDADLAVKHGRDRRRYRGKRPPLVGAVPGCGRGVLQPLLEPGQPRPGPGPSGPCDAPPPSPYRVTEQRHGSDHPRAPHPGTPPRCSPVGGVTCQQPRPAAATMRTGQDPRHHETLHNPQPTHPKIDICELIAKRVRSSQGTMAVDASPIMPGTASGRRRWSMLAVRGRSLSALRRLVAGQTKRRWA